MTNGEHELQQRVIDYLINNNFLVLRINSGRTGKTTFNRWYDNSLSFTAGISDILAVKDGKLYCIEIKRAGKITNLSDEQRLFLVSALAHGAEVMVVDDLVTFTDALKPDVRTRPV